MDPTLKKSSQRIAHVLKEQGLETQVIEFQQLTRTAQEAADAIGCTVGQIAKTIIFKGMTTGALVCVIASGPNRVDEKKVERYIGEAIGKADPEFVLKSTGFAIGGVPPIGYELKVAALIDEDLMAYQEIWAAAGTPHSVFQLSPSDLLKITQGTVANVRK